MRVSIAVATFVTLGSTVSAQEAATVADLGTLVKSLSGFVSDLENLNVPGLLDQVPHILGNITAIGADVAQGGANGTNPVKLVNNTVNGLCPTLEKLLLKTNLPPLPPQFAALQALLGIRVNGIASTLPSLLQPLLNALKQIGSTTPGTQDAIKCLTAILAKLTGGSTSTRTSTAVTSTRTSTTGSTTASSTTGSSMTGSSTTGSSTTGASTTTELTTASSTASTTPLVIFPTTSITVPTTLFSIPTTSLAITTTSLALPTTIITTSLVFTTPAFSI